MATVEQLTIQFEGKGAPALTGQLNALSAAMNRLAGRQKQVTKSTKKGSTATDSYNNRLTKNGRNVQALTASFGKFGMRMSQMRSKLLIVAFAVGIVTKAFKSLTDAFAEYSKLNFRINALLKTTQFAAGKTAKSLDNMANSLEKTMGVSSTQVKEIQQSMKDQNPICKRCDDASLGIHIPLMERVYGHTAKPQFKGNGFYETDYKDKK